MQTWLCIPHFGRVCFRGDVYRTDYPSLGDVPGATVESFLDDYKMALDMTTPNTIFVPGHGQLSTRADLADSVRSSFSFMRVFRDMVARGHDPRADYGGPSL